MALNNTLNKSELRKSIISSRNMMSKEDVYSKSLIICNKIIALDVYKNADIILLYCDYNNEVATDILFNRAISDGKIVAYPKCITDNGEPNLEFYIIDDMNKLCFGYKGIREPDTDRFTLDKITGMVDLCIVPGVAFDPKCNRIGYGKGFYDRFLGKKIVSNAIGVCYNIQIQDAIIPSKYDYCLDQVITESYEYMKGK